MIAVDKAGTLYAFQLKGDPGSRLTISKWNQIYQQIIQLVGTPVPKHLTKNKSTSHIPVLVTNGEIDESVRSAIELFNSQTVPSLPGSRALQTWSRGQLLKLFNLASGVVWPGNLATQILFLRSISNSGLAAVHLSDVQELATNSLRWGTECSKAAAIERAAGAATLAAIFSTRYIEQGNFYEVIKIQTIFLCTIKCYLGNAGVKTKTSERLLRALTNDLFERLEDFSLWIVSEFLKKPFIVNSPFSEFGLYHARKIMAMALVAVYLLAKRRASPNYLLDDATHEFLSKPIDFPFLQSEGLVPSFLSVFWAKDCFLASQRNSIELMRVINSIIKSQNNRLVLNQLPAPYYELEEVIKWRFKKFLGRAWHDLDQDSNYRRSWFLYPMLLMLVRRNFKQTVKYLWPDVTRIMHFCTDLADAREFPLAKAKSAAERSFNVKIPASWNDLIRLVQRPPVPTLPEELIDDPTLILLLCLFLPHRMSPNIVAWLDRSLIPKAWY